MTLFCNFQVGMAKKQMGVDADDNDSVATEPDVKETAAAAAAKKIVEPVLLTARPTSSAGEGTLGATPRYTTNADYNAVTYNSIKPSTAKNPKKKIIKIPQAPAKATPLALNRIPGMVAYK